VIEIGGRLEFVLLVLIVSSTIVAVKIWGR
jgi:hypothetical protein